MSCHYHAFVGPYIEVHNPLRIGTKSVKTCTNEKCSKHGAYSADSFCSKCGSAIGEVNIPCRERKKFDVWTEFGGKEPFYEISGERLKIDNDYVLYHSNMNKGPGRTLYENCVILPMDAAFVQNEIDSLKTFHVKELARLKEVFGDESVKIKWGGHHLLELTNLGPVLYFSRNVTTTLKH
jgi:hypothetical protein